MLLEALLYLDTYATGIRTRKVLGMSEQRIYRPGDTVSLDLDLNDESGIQDVVVHSRLKGAGGQDSEQLNLSGHGKGQRSATVTVSAIVPERIRPGEYETNYTQLRDSLGNYSSPTIDATFTIEAPESDLVGPELTDWRFSS